MTETETIRGPIQAAVAHASKGVSYAVVKEENGKPRVLRFTSDPTDPLRKHSKTDLLTKVLRKGDTLFMDLGGVGDKLALAAAACGIDVRRFPSHRLTPEHIAGDKPAIIGHRTIKVGPTEYLLSDERARGEETGLDLTARRNRAFALLSLGMQAPEEFYALRVDDLSLVRLGIEYRSLARMKKAALRTYLGLLAAYRDRLFVELAFHEKTEAQSREELLSQIAEDMLGGDIAEAEKKDFFARIGELIGEDMKLPTEPKKLKAFLDALLESDQVNGTVLRRIKEQQKRVERLLKGGKTSRGKNATTVPANVIWERVFAPIDGCGPLIGARMIAGIGDIRAFASEAKLRAYAGYHHFPDGSRARRMGGKTSNWSPSLKQGVFLWAQGIVKMPGSAWRAELDARKAYELYKILAARQTQVEKEGLPYRILPSDWVGRSVTSVRDVTAEDYALFRDSGKVDAKGKPIKELIGGLAFHVEELRKQAGTAYEEPAEDADDVDEEDENEAEVVKDPALAKLVRGVKGSAHNKALRWLGQRFLRHVYREWRKAIGLPAKSPDDRTSNAVGADPRVCPVAGGMGDGV